VELKDLTLEERIALVALLDLVVAADRDHTDDEAEAVRALIARVGEESYQEAVDAHDERFGDDDGDLRAFLESLGRQEARETIYEAVLEVAMPDAIGPSEAELLDWLAKAWGVTVRFEDPSQSGT
jgi:uncharacterized tellurite resistance protein B-like protein